MELKKIPDGERIFDTELFLEGKKVAITLKTERNRSEISCFAKYETQIECECARCLEIFQQKISGEVRFFIVPECEGFDDDDFDRYYYKNENDKIDFTQTIRDDVFTQIPMKPLCREDCAGIILQKKKDSDVVENGQWTVLKKLIKLKSF